MPAAGMSPPAIPCFESPLPSIPFFSNMQLHYHNSTRPFQQPRKPGCSWQVHGQESIYLALFPRSRFPNRRYVEHQQARSHFSTILAELRKSCCHTLQNPLPPCSPKSSLYRSPCCLQLVVFS